MDNIIIKTCDKTNDEYKQWLLEQLEKMLKCESCKIMVRELLK